MTLPSSGAISMAMVAAEIGTVLPLSMTDSRVRQLIGKPTGPVVLPTDFYGKSWYTSTSFSMNSVAGGPILGYVPSQALGSMTPTALQGFPIWGFYSQAAPASTQFHLTIGFNPGKDYLESITMQGLAEFSVADAGYQFIADPITPGAFRAIWQWNGRGLLTGLRSVQIRHRP